MPVNERDLDASYNKQEGGSAWEQGWGCHKTDNHSSQYCSHLMQYFNPSPDVGIGIHQTSAGCECVNMDMAPLLHPLRGAAQRGSMNKIRHEF